MKRIFVLLLTLSILFSLCACNTRSNEIMDTVPEQIEATNSTTEQPENQTPTEEIVPDATEPSSVDCWQVKDNLSEPILQDSKIQDGTWRNHLPSTMAIVDGIERNPISYAFFDTTNISYSEFDSEQPETNNVDYCVNIDLEDSDMSCYIGLSSFSLESSPHGIFLSFYGKTLAESQEMIYLLLANITESEEMAEYITYMPDTKSDGYRISSETTFYTQNDVYKIERSRLFCKGLTPQDTYWETIIIIDIQNEDANAQIERSNILYDEVSDMIAVSLGYDVKSHEGADDLKLSTILAERLGLDNSYEIVIRAIEVKKQINCGSQYWVRFNFRIIHNGQFIMSTEMRQYYYDRNFSHTPESVADFSYYYYTDIDQNIDKEHLQTENGQLDILILSKLIPTPINENNVSVYDLILTSIQNTDDTQIITQAFGLQIDNIISTHQSKITIESR